METVKIYGNLIKETDKAINVELNWQHLETPGKNHKWVAWLPKSKATVSDSSIPMWGRIKIEVPIWLADKIGNEIREKYGMIKHLGGKGIIYNLC